VPASRAPRTFAAIRDSSERGDRILKTAWSCAVTALPLLPWGCAPARRAPATMALSCARLFGTAPRGTAVPVRNRPELLNSRDVLQGLTRLYRGAASREAMVQLLVRPDGHASHGCVRWSSGDREFDRAALRAALESARFHPAELNGDAVDAWVIFPVGMIGRQVR